MLNIDIAETANLADALRKQGVALKMSCGGNGSCKTCRVVLGNEAVLACQTEVPAGTHKVIVSAHALQPESFQLDMHLDVDFEARKPQRRFQQRRVHIAKPDDLPGKSDIERLRIALGQPEIEFSLDTVAGIAHSGISGDAVISIWDDQVIEIATGEPSPFSVLAIDIGTTTISCALLDVDTGEILAQAGKANAQYNYAEDLAARISFCNTKKRIAEMRTLLLRDSLIPLTQELLSAAGRSSSGVLTTVVSGNAPMIHIMIGYDPTSMGGYPFNGVDFAPPARAARKFGLPGPTVEFQPASSAYFGGDAVSGLWFERIADADDGTLFLDLGTNAEMALMHGGKLFSTAAPAGPAFEGGGLAWGIGGVDGAIDRIWEDGDDLRFSTIGNKPARGICGSGVISFVAAAFRAGGVSKAGRFRQRAEIHPIQFGDQTLKAWFLTDEIYVTEEDISKFLQAKAAVFSAMHSLCRLAGIHPMELAEVRIAGNFGRFLKIKDIIAIGLLPEIDPARIKICGNTSLAGAVMSAFDKRAKREQLELVQQLEFVELNALPTFQDDFIDALFLPHRSKELFPSGVLERKKRRRARTEAA